MTFMIIIGNYCGVNYKKTSFRLGSLEGGKGKGEVFMKGFLF